MNGIQISKPEILKAMETLPDPVSLDEIIERLIFLRKIKQVLSEARQEKKITKEEVEKMFRTSATE